jgi:hypothetical protein
MKSSLAAEPVPMTCAPFHAGGGLDEDRLARLQLDHARRKKGVPCRQADHRHGRCVDMVERLRLRGEAVGIHRGILGKGAEPLGEVLLAEHLVADLEVARVGADLLDRAGKIDPGDHRQLVLHERGEVALAHLPVHGID